MITNAHINERNTMTIVNRFADRLLNRVVPAAKAKAETCNPGVHYRCTNRISSLCNGNWHVQQRITITASCGIWDWHDHGCCPA